VTARFSTGWSGTGCAAEFRRLWKSQKIRAGGRSVFGHPAVEKAWDGFFNGLIRGGRQEPATGRVMQIVVFSFQPAWFWSFYESIIIHSCFCPQKKVPAGVSPAGTFFVHSHPLKTTA
jgi:hypothetical protein